MLGNYADISPGCKGCCHEGEPSLTWMFCDYCIRNTRAIEIEKIKDCWTEQSKKWNYYDYR